MQINSAVNTADKDNNEMVYNHLLMGGIVCMKCSHLMHLTLMLSGYH